MNSTFGSYKTVFETLKGISSKVSDRAAVIDSVAARLSEVVERPVQVSYYESFQRTGIVYCWSYSVNAMKKWEHDFAPNGITVSGDLQSVDGKRVMLNVIPDVDNINNGFYEAYELGYDFKSKSPFVKLMKYESLKNVFKLFRAHLNKEEEAEQAVKDTAQYLEDMQNLQESSSFSDDY